MAGKCRSLLHRLCHGATLSVDIHGDVCRCAFRRQRRRAQPISPGFEPADADRERCAHHYAVTKRHELIEKGLPSKALRLAVVRTASGIGHLVLVVVTTKGDIVMDDLTEALRPWQSTDYQWLKIQSAADARFWHEVKAPAA